MKNLDPGIAEMLANLNQLPGPKYWTLPAPEARKITDDPYFVEQFNGRPEPIFEVTQRDIPVSGGKIPIRIYTPREIPENETLPVLIYLHGGGWVLGNLDVYEAPLHTLAKYADCIIVSVGYRLAPEFPFPIPVEDCLSAARWIARHAAEFGGDAGRLAVGGDSAGGNLTAVVAQAFRKEGEPKLALQILIYPWLTAENAFPSRKEFAEGYFLTQASLNWCIQNYLLNPEEAKSPQVSPLLATDFRNLPPALILTAGFDPLRDDGNVYADKLRSAGVAVQYRCYEDMIHGFVSMGALTRRAREALEQCAEALRGAWGTRKAVLR